MKLSTLADDILSLAKANAQFETSIQEANSGGVLMPRFIVALAGPPASGKSTLAKKLCAKLNELAPNLSPIIVPMDGFHFDNEKLDVLNLRPRKGAPNTFDVEGFENLLERIYEDQESVSVPQFDRTIDKVVDNGMQVTPENRLIIVEGNYLLVEEEPWDGLRAYFDLPIFLLPKTKDLETRLIQRWLNEGFSQGDAQEKAFSNDIPNAKYTLANSAYVDLTFETISDQ